MIEGPVCIFLLKSCISVCNFFFAPGSSSPLWIHWGSTSTWLLMASQLERQMLSFVPMKTLWQPCPKTRITCVCTFFFMLPVVTLALTPLLLSIVPDSRRDWSSYMCRSRIIVSNGNVQLVNVWSKSVAQFENLGCASLVKQTWLDCGSNLGDLPSTTLPAECQMHFIKTIYISIPLHTEKCR